MEDESEIKQRILENIEEYVTSGLSKKVTNILETIKLLAFFRPVPPLNRTASTSRTACTICRTALFQESRLFCQNRLPVRYETPKPLDSPDRWLTLSTRACWTCRHIPHLAGKVSGPVSFPAPRAEDDDAHCRQGGAGKSHRAGAEAAHEEVQQWQRQKVAAKPLYPSFFSPIGGASL